MLTIVIHIPWGLIHAVGLILLLFAVFCAIITTPIYMNQRVNNVTGLKRGDCFRWKWVCWIQIWRYHDEQRQWKPEKRADGLWYPSSIGWRKHFRGTP